MWAAATVTVITWCVAPVEPATAQTSVPPGPVNAQLIARASRGYTAHLSSEGDKIQLGLFRGLFSSLVYTFYGRVSTEEIDARIAGLGSIDLRFVPTGKTKRVRPPRSCSGPVTRLTEGHFIGSFRFR